MTMRNKTLGLSSFLTAGLIFAWLAAALPAMAQEYRAILLPLQPETLNKLGPRAFTSDFVKDKRLLTSAGPLSIGNEGQLFSNQKPGDLSHIYYFEAIAAKEQGRLVFKTPAGSLNRATLARFIRNLERSAAPELPEPRLVVLSIVAPPDLVIDMRTQMAQLQNRLKHTSSLVLINRAQTGSPDAVLKTLAGSATLLGDIINGFPDLAPLGNQNGLIEVIEIKRFLATAPNIDADVLDLVLLSSNRNGFWPVTDAAAASTQNIQRYRAEAETARLAIANINVRALREYSITCYYCPFRDKVDQALVELERAVERQADEALEAEIALSLRSEDALFSYLLTCDTCPRQAEIETAFTNLKTQQISDRDDKLWQQASTGGNVADLETYERECRVCSHEADSAQMRSRISAIQAESQLLDATILDGSLEAFRRYLLECETCQARDELEQELENRELALLQRMSLADCRILVPSPASESQFHSAADLARHLKSCDLPGATAADELVLKARAQIGLNRLTRAKSLIDQIPREVFDQGALAPHLKTLKTWLELWKSKRPASTAQIQSLFEAALEDDTSAILILGELMVQGKLPPNLQPNVETWLVTRSSQGSGYADALLGQIKLMRGELEAGIAQLRQGAYRGNGTAAGQLASLYETGTGLEQSIEKAATLALYGLALDSEWTEAWLIENNDRRNPALVEEIQIRLESGGFYKSNIDGQLGPGTLNAISAYQDSRGKGRHENLALAFQRGEQDTAGPLLARLDDPGALTGLRGNNTSGVQYVVFAFDGSKSLDMWRETRAFSQRYKVPFTYFISGVYFLSDDEKKAYQGPRKRTGYSEIGFGGEPSEIRERMRQVIMAHREGHEIASHANGHFNGGRWTREDWQKEFRQFRTLLDQAPDRYQLNPNLGQEFKMIAQSVEGFRAPQLAVSRGLWPVLGEFGFNYDTSRIEGVNYQPRADRYGTWNFPLASLSTDNGRVLSMDYNFYFKDSQAKPDPANADLYEERMLAAYRAYFTNNFNGSKAPLHIGHHFSKWNGGAYWRAFQRFAAEVCTIPGVECVTYRELQRKLG